VFAEGECPAHPAIAGRRIDPAVRGRFFDLQAFVGALLTASGLGRGGVDLVHAHGDHNMAWAAARLARRWKCPSVLTIHGGLSDHLVHRWLSGQVYRHLTMIIAVSGAIRCQLEKLGVPPEQVAVMSSGVDTRRFAPMPREAQRLVRSRFGLPVEGPIVAATGRLHPVKGFQHLVAASHRLRSVAPSAVVAIAGDGPQRERLEAMARAAPTVRLLGRLDADGVADLLRAADLFVLPSLELPGQREGTPTSIMEAMAAGLPIVATRTGGIPELVQDGRNGLIVPPADPEALAEAMAALLGSPEMLERIGTHNRADVADRDWRVVVRQIGSIYDQAQMRHRQSVTSRRTLVRRVTSG
jgi:glycosyltransferase involved in cell wall biosynthesis